MLRPSEAIVDISKVDDLLICTQPKLLIPDVIYNLMFVPGLQNIAVPVAQFSFINRTI